MRAGWRRVTIGDVCRIVSGTTPDTATAAYWNGPFAWITPTDLGTITDGVINVTERTLTKAAISTYRLELVPPNSVVMSSRAPIGHLAITAMEASLNQECKGFVCGEQLNPNFLFHALRAHKARLQALGRGATFAEVSKSALETYSIEIPPIDEQVLVAARLDAQTAVLRQATTMAREQSSDTKSLLDVVLGAFSPAIPRSVPHLVCRVHRQRLRGGLGHV